MKKQVKEMMSRDVEVVTPDCTVQRVAEKMGALDVGAIPVCEGEKLLGMVTDRDITTRIVAKGIDPRQATAQSAMSSPVIYCNEDQDVGDVIRIMQAKQIRRLPVIDRDRKLVGVVSINDLYEERQAA